MRTLQYHLTVFAQSTKVRRERTLLYVLYACCCLQCIACSTAQMPIIKPNTDSSTIQPPIVQQPIVQPPVVQQPQQDTARDKRLLALLELRPDPMLDSATCEAIYALDSPDRYIYKRVQDDPPGTPRFEYDVPDTILNSMSTRGLLETGLGHPRNAELAPLTVCSSIWRCRESMFSFLMNVWPAFEKRPDALEECLKRYDKLSVSCEPLTRNVPPVLGRRAIFYVPMQITLIEVVLTRPAFLNQLSPKVQRKLAAKVLAKLRQADMFYSSELGKTQGLWLLGALMLFAKDSAFTEETRQNEVVALIARGLVGGHSLQAKAVILAHAERFAAAQ